MGVIELEEIDTGLIGTVGGKAAGLGEMIAAGERVPPGFCLTAEAHVSGTVPEGELAAAYERLGGGPVAVRSSATAEDLPGSSFAGQLDTLLDVRGTEELVEAVRRCWASLDSDRAVAYREAAGADRADTHMAVVVQRMVEAGVAGVLFTADPLTGSRSRAVVDAAPGPGPAVVDGGVVPDHHVLVDGEPAAAVEGGCLAADQLEELRAAGRRLAEHFGSPQDVEWAYDADGVLWLLQSRPITTLFPTPPDAGVPGQRLYLEVGHMQGMLRPFTPMGMDRMTHLWVRWCSSHGIDAGPREGASILTPVGGRLYLDLTDFMRSAPVRARLPRAMEVYGPRVRRAVEYLLDDARFSPSPGLPFAPGPALRFAARLLPTAVARVAATIARPARARAGADRALEEFRSQPRPGPETTAAERLAFVSEDAYAPVLGAPMMAVAWPTFAGILLGLLPSALLDGVATDEELDAVLGGMPHNVTTEMDLALWRVAENADAHRALFLETDPAELADMYRQGALPDIGLADFLAVYGHRAAAEVDIGMPRWAEDPSPLLSAIANYLRVEDPEQAPDRRFARAAVRARRTISELSLRGRARRPVRGRIASFAMRRSRELTGARELAKFSWLIPFAEMRRQLLLIGADLVRRGLLERADDVMFLTMDEVRAAVHDGADHRSPVAGRRAVHDREVRRPHVPVLLLSDGTDVETILPRPEAEEGALPGMPAAAGRATGRARVVRDPSGARVEPGEILVAPTTDPGWTPLFMTAAGLVAETGSPVAHGPTVAREYGIPAVVCVRDAMRQIRTGQVVTVDGTAGTVTVESAESGAPEGSAAAEPVADGAAGESGTRG
ncbi:PEP/pyruvate-binding domain-containing protein [Nocardiopsis sp. FIRDI 009]|uniref:PEP/pyruvate-binding domain-containing protein n=1 Tax=Nocardiopsis sp. FIRDI 009 TaxID=714197 RepID=UPI000E25DE6B|nr:PEP/pyruvate-binding domain-containing protein [Nocardiopsis sp. FIRDI 009]